MLEAVKQHVVMSTLQRLVIQQQNIDILT